jgi:PAS domain S-box-containing protein
MKILVVEDDIPLLEILKTILFAQNYAVETAVDGETARDLIATYDYDLILLDVLIPKLDGIRLCQFVRGRGLEVPILLLTGKDSSHDKAIGLNAGADDYVVKPFDEEELIARIHALLRRGRISTQPILEVGNLKLDPSNCEVKYGEKILSLTPKEYGLLELFMRNKKRVFSCSMILEHLWSYDETPGEEAVRTHIKGLRHKLKAAGVGSDLIETVYGIGYRLKKLTKEVDGVKNHPQDKSIDNLDSQADSLDNNSGNNNLDNTIEEKTRTAIAKIWDKFKDRVDTQVNILIQAANVIKNNESNHHINLETLTSARQEAHTLAGSLGTFGFAEASKIAKRIEVILNSQNQLNKNEIETLNKLTQALSLEIKQPLDEKSRTLKSLSIPQVEVGIEEKKLFNHHSTIKDNGEVKLREIPQPLSTVSNSENITPTAREERILAVDDDQKILEILEVILLPWGFKTYTLNNPQYFWDTLEATNPDLLILDVEIPGFSGIELCTAIRNHPNWCDLPIIFLTVHNDTDTINQVFGAGADDFVNKPIIAPELITRINNRLERSKLIRRVFQNQQKTRDELRNSQALCEGIINIADDAIISIDRDQSITIFNSGAEKIFGYEAEEVLGKKLDTLIPSRFINSHQNHVREFGNSPQQSRKMAERREIFALHKDGSEFPAEASISKLNLGGEIIYTVYLQDVSHRKQIEKMKDEFVSVVSHELRTPLTSIHGSLGMLASGLIQPESERGQQLLKIAANSTKRLVRLINDILDIERIESGKVRMEKQICQVENLITEAVNIMQSIANKARVNLDVSNLSINIWADPDRIIQTLTNLLSNAIKFSPAGSTVYLAAIEQKDDVLFSIKDSGRGIPEDKKDIIFERFQQIDASDSRKQDGTGLGLAISKSIVRQHQGNIWVESTPGEGSDFYFTIPISKAKLLPESPERTRENFYSPKILICADDNFAQMLVTLLEKYGVETFIAKTSREAIRKSQEIDPDLMILDLILPEFSDFDAIEWLQQHDRLYNISLVVYSARDLNDMERTKLKLGRTEFLIKGQVTTAEFEQKVVELIAELTQNRVSEAGTSSR